jgi:hypothetical protein
VLLALREDLERFLDAQDLKLIWIVTGTKWALGGNNLGHRPSGKRLIFGTLRYNGDRISGKVGSRLETSPAGNF